MGEAWVTRARQPKRRLHCLRLRHADFVLGGVEVLTCAHFNQ
jgi:hypothetical protein